MLTKITTMLFTNIFFKVQQPIKAAVCCYLTQWVETTQDRDGLGTKKKG